MSVTLPESVDAWRMVSARRSFEGTLPIAAMSRLREVLAGTDGVLRIERIPLPKQCDRAFLRDRFD